MMFKCSFFEEDNELKFGACSWAGLKVNALHRYRLESANLSRVLFWTCLPNLRLSDSYAYDLRSHALLMCLLKYYARHILVTELIKLN